MDKRWVACISQTGSELYELCERMMRKPDVLIITNESKVIPEIWDMEIDSIFVFKKRPTAEQLFAAFSGADLITLHGYLYILPAEVCEAYAGKIFNGHPGLITKYPELRGKDPQVRAWDNYSRYGCILHEVTAGVDEGPVIDSDEISAEYVKDLNNLFIVLKKLSINLWLRFFAKAFEEERVYENSLSRNSLNWEDNAAEGIELSRDVFRLQYFTGDNQVD